MKVTYALHSIVLFLALSVFTDAQNPTLINTVKQGVELTASNGTDGDGFGASVATNGDTIVVGAADHNQRMGAAYVFVKPKGGWLDATQTAILSASDGQFGDSLGASVAISPNTILVGAPLATSNGNHSGALYVFVKPANGWVNMTETAKLTASDGASDDDLGQSVAISGNTVVSGAPAAGGDGQSLGPGAAYVFVEPKGGWANMTETAKLTAANGSNDDEFGFAVAIDDDTVVVGAPEAPYLNGPGPGADYVFIKPENGWTDGNETAQLTASNGEGGDGLGGSVSIGGTTIASGAVLANELQGAVYVFVEPKSGWQDTTETAELEPVATRFGASVAFSGNGGSIVAGEPSKKGAAYVFSAGPQGWITTSEYKLRVQPKGLQNGDFFGASVAINGNTGVAGAPNHPFSTQKGPGPGAAYVYGR